MHVDMFMFLIQPLLFPEFSRIPFNDCYFTPGLILSAAQTSNDFYRAENCPPYHCANADFRHVVCATLRF